MLDLIKEQVLLLDEDTLSHILEISNRDNEMKQLHAEKVPASDRYDSNL